MAQQCARNLTAEVAAHDEVIFYNRYGAFDPGGMMFSLREDLVPINPARPLGPGNAKVRPSKRPRPLVLRMNEGDCLTIFFRNWLAPIRVNDRQPATRTAGLHVMGMQVQDEIWSDGSNVGMNQSSLAEPGESKTYTIYAERQGTFFLYSTAANVGGLGNGGTLTRGLWGAINVQPKGAEWYRSEVSNSDLEQAIARDGQNRRMYTPGTPPSGGHPIVNYDARYPTNHPLAGRPILSILDGTRIVHSDLNAIITGPGKGRFPDDTFLDVAVRGDRRRPYREMTVLFHEAFGIVQAFPQFTDPVFGPTIEEGFDGFGINYVAMGVGATVLANRLGVGPARNCAECKFEEFFLTSWAIGDPGLLVDIPANAPMSDPSTGLPVLDANGQPVLQVGPKATMARYPADPSNVFHAYLNDRVIIRNLHAGPTEHHIFHLHAHQWLRHPNGDNSEYLDSQAIGPGHGFTYELTYTGAGNRTRTPGDAILHCHFYPHFAAGMWGLLRSHDTFEPGTRINDESGRPAAGARVYPDGEIVAGTPIPAVIPLPGEPLPVMPTSDFPGYPFYVAGLPGQRPPKPPLDTEFDGGLSRHVVVGGTSHFEPINRFDFNKEVTALNVQFLPEEGTVAEKRAMEFHAGTGGVSVSGGKGHSTFSVDPVTKQATNAVFRVNGQPPIKGAPFADPCTRDNGGRIGTNRWYKGAVIQLDAKYNKAGWHYPQHRMFALWDDVNDYLSGNRPPEPLFMRTSTGDCIEYQLINLVPSVWEQDDFQVRTPTDVIGQHIHLVKFDVTASDGGANGWNYEDGAFSPDETRERIHAIRNFRGVACTPGVESPGCPIAKAHPRFGAGPGGKWVGAQVNVQRWYTDDVLNALGHDRTLGSIFTHDHFGPTTHQQAGLYASMVGEPAGSTWYHSETGVKLGTRNSPGGDGGPTSWQARIEYKDENNRNRSVREFLLMLQDFALAYDATHQGLGPNPTAAINPAGKVEGDIGQLLLPPYVKGLCQNGASPVFPAPTDPDQRFGCPELFAADNVGMWSVNYRNEPIALRVRDPVTNTQPLNDGADLALVFQSRTDRPDPRFNRQPTFYRPLTGGLRPGDPFTPLLRAYVGDEVEVRVMVGAHEESHHFSIHGMKWHPEPDDPNSGWMNGQFMGISEKFKFVVPPITGRIAGNEADYLWQAGTSTEDLWSGSWGLLRSYQKEQKDLKPLPSNPVGSGKNFGTVANANQFNEQCPKTAPTRVLKVSAYRARDILPGGTLVYNQKFGLHDPTAIMYVRDEDIGRDGKLKPAVPIEPLILRARAGECIDVRLTNKLPQVVGDLPGWSTLPMIVYDPVLGAFNSNQLMPSSRVGLRPQLVAYDVTRSDGSAVGNNPNSTAAPEIRDALGNVIRAAESKRYLWYAGNLTYNQATQTLSAEPIEFGAVNLMSPDRIKHSQKGAMGVLIIEPLGSTWVEDAHSRAAATVTKADGSRFREFVLVFQDDISLQHRDPLTGVDLGPLPNVAGAHDHTDAGHKAINYRNEPVWARAGFPAAATEAQRNDYPFYGQVLSSWVHGDPETPIFRAKQGDAIRFRLLHPGGASRGVAFHVHGHGGEEAPWVNNARELGTNPESEWKGVIFGMGPTAHFNFLLTNGAGGRFQVPGDYLYRNQMVHGFDQGQWGILRVEMK